MLALFTATSALVLRAPPRVVSMRHRSLVMGPEQPDETWTTTSSGLQSVLRTMLRGLAVAYPVFATRAQVPGCEGW